MRLGLWGARGDRRGLAIQASEFSRHMRPERIMAFDLRGVRDSTAPLDWSDYRYPGCDLTIAKYPKITKQQAQSWMQGLDVVWGCETFYQDDFPAWAAEIGVATVQHCNSEFYRFDKEPRLPRPTVELVPARWRMDVMSGKPDVLPCPLALDRLPYRPRGTDETMTFLHVVGVKASEDRNGTDALLHALKYVTEPCRLIIRTQSALGVETEYQQVYQVKLEVRHSDLPHYWSLYDEGDVLILPRRYGGQCLPMLEAMACGLPVAMPNCEPNRDIVPRDWLLPIAGTSQLTTQSGSVTVHHPDPEGIAALMNRACRERAWVRKASAHVREQAEALSWERWREQYALTLERAVAAMRAG